MRLTVKCIAGSRPFYGAPQNGGSAMLNCLKNVNKCWYDDGVYINKLTG